MYFLSHGRAGGSRGVLISSKPLAFALLCSHLRVLFSALLGHVRDDGLSLGVSLRGAGSVDTHAFGVPTGRNAAGACQHKGERDIRKVAHVSHRSE